MACVYQALGPPKNVMYCSMSQHDKPVSLAADYCITTNIGTYYFTIMDQMTDAASEKSKCRSEVYSNATAAQSAQCIKGYVQ